MVESFIWKMFLALRELSVENFFGELFVEILFIKLYLGVFCGKFPWKSLF